MAEHLKLAEILVRIPTEGNLWIVKRVSKHSEKFVRKSTKLAVKSPHRVKPPDYCTPASSPPAAGCSQLQLGDEFS